MKICSVQNSNGKQCQCLQSKIFVHFCYKIKRNDFELNQKPFTFMNSTGHSKYVSK